MPRKKREDNAEKQMYIICTILLLISFLCIIIFNSSINIIGAVILEETEIKSEFKYIEPEVITRDSALNALLDAEDDIKEMLDLNLSTYFVKDILLKAKRTFFGDKISNLEKSIESEREVLKKSYLRSLLYVAKDTPLYEIEKLNYSEVLKLTQLIAFKKQQTYRILDTIALVEDKENQYRKNKIDTSEGLELLNEAKKSFREERYDEAEAYLKEAEIKLDKASLEYKRVKRIVKLSKNFFLRYWWQIILTIIILAVITTPIFKKVRKSLTKKKLEVLKLELQTIKKLIKKSQEDCFKNKKITVETYKIRVDMYKTRMVEIKHTIPVLEAIVSGKKKVDKKKKEKAKKIKGVLEIKE